MPRSIKAGIVRISRWKWTRTILGLALATALLWNSLFVKLSILGFSVSLLILFVGCRSAADLFFNQEKPFVREILGFAAFVSMAALAGIALILTTFYTELFSLVSVTVIQLILCFASALKTPQRVSQNVENLPQQSKIANSKRSLTIVLLGLYIVSTAVTFYTLFRARTGEGEISVWLNIPSYFIVLFFSSSLCLLSVLFFTRIRNGLKLLLVSVQSLLSHSLFLIVWYPGRYGDPWSYLAEMRFIAKTGTIYAYSHLLQNFYISDIIKYQAQYSLALLFKAMLLIDIYWVHIVLIPILWSLLVPVLMYKLADSLTDNKNSTYLLLAAVGAGLFSTLVYWGAVDTANSLGFIFLLLSVVLLISWFDTGKRSFWLLSFVACLATLMAHPQPGIFAFVFLLTATILKTNLHAVLKAFSYVALFLAYPAVLYAHSAEFSLTGLINLENLLSFLFGAEPLLLVLVSVGIIFTLRSKHVKRRNAALLILFSLTIITSYYVTAYGMANLPYGPERIIVIADFLLVPFVALGLIETKIVLSTRLSLGKRNPTRNKVLTGGLILLAISILVSAQFALTIYNAYPRNEISPVQPSWYEMQAIYYINSTSKRYVVLSEPGFTSLAIGLLGSDYAYPGGRHGFFGIPDWYEWQMQLWEKMVRSPSLDVVREAMDKLSSVEIVYFVVSVRTHGYDLETIVEQTSQILPVDRTFGGGKLYVFKYTVEPQQGPGPNIQVVFDNGAFTDNVTTEFSYVTPERVTYLARLSGHSNYNITDYPEFWLFSSISVNQTVSKFDESSNVNRFIYISKLNPPDNVELVWQANNLYQRVGWKEDSFKAGWQTSPFSHGKMSPQITTDGDILQMSWNFTGETDYYQYAKRVDVSTSDFPYILLRWMSTGPVAEVQITYTDDGSQKESIVPYGSQSSSLTTALVKLQPGRVITYVELGITSYADPTGAIGLQTVYYDFILICAPT